MWEVATTFATRTNRRIAAAGCFVPLPGEPDTGEVIRRLRETGVVVWLPVLQPDRGLSWARLGRDPLVAGLRGTKVPPGPAVADPGLDLMVVPVVAVDRAGRRLGRGGGSYDRAIATVRTRARPPLVVALAHDADVLDEVPAEDHDQAVDAVVTPTRSWHCPPWHRP